MSRHDTIGTRKRIRIELLQKMVAIHTVSGGIHIINCCEMRAYWALFCREYGRTIHGVHCNYFLQHVLQLHHESRHVLSDFRIAQTSCLSSPGLWMKRAVSGDTTPISGEINPLRKVIPKRAKIREFQGCSPLRDYELLEKIGEGTFG